MAKNDQKMTKNDFFYQKKLKFNKMNRIMAFQFLNKKQLIYN